MARTFHTRIVNAALVFALTIFFSIPQAIGKPIDKLEKLYQKHRYEKCIKHSRKLASDKDYRSSPLPHLYAALSYYQLDTQQEPKANGSSALRQSIRELSLFYRKDKSGAFAEAYRQDINQLKAVYETEADRLFNINKRSSAKYYYKHIANVFQDTTPNYRSLLLPPRPKIATTVDQENSDFADASNIPQNRRDSIIALAKTLVGTPYVYGGTNTNGLDCSGFTGYVMKPFGYALPHSSGSQAKLGKKVDATNAKPGDLAIFGYKTKNNGYKVQHVALVLENDEEQGQSVIHATNRGVIIDNVPDSSYWKPKFLFNVNIVDHERQ